MNSTAAAASDDELMKKILNRERERAGGNSKIMKLESINFKQHIAQVCVCLYITQPIDLCLLYIYSSMNFSISIDSAFIDNYSFSMHAAYTTFHSFPFRELMHVLHALKCTFEVILVYYFKEEFVIKYFHAIHIMMQQCSDVSLENYDDNKLRMIQET